MSEHQQDLDWLPASCLLKTHLAAPAFSFYFTCTLNNHLDLEHFHARLQSPSRQISQQFNRRITNSELMFLSCCAGWESRKLCPEYLCKCSHSNWLVNLYIKAHLWNKHLSASIILILEAGQLSGLSSEFGGLLVYRTWQTKQSQKHSFVLICIGGCD